MFLRNRKILQLLLTLFIILSILAWKLLLWKASIEIESAAPFSVTFKTPKQIQGIHFECPASPCQFKMTPQKYRMTIAAEGFFPITEEVEIFWRKTNIFRIPLEKIPVLSVLPEKPSSWSATRVEGEKEIKYIINSENEVFAQKNGKNTFIAELQFTEPTTNPNILVDAKENRLFIYNSTEVFEVNIVEKRKFRIFFAAEGELLTDIEVFDGDLLLIKGTLQEKERSFFFVPSLRRVVAFPEETKLDLVCQNPENFTEFFYLIHSKSTWLLKKVSTQTQEIEGIAGYEFLTPPEDMYCESSNSIFIKTAEEFFNFNI